MRYPKEVMLKEGEDAIIRPLGKDDESELSEFYGKIAEKDRWYTRYDITDPKVIQKWIEGVDRKSVISMIALCNENFIAHASLHMRSFGFTKHIGRVRIMVLPEFRHKRLGTWMLLDLIKLAMDKGLSKLRADFVVGVEDTAIDAAHKLDFFETACLKNYVQDAEGQPKDLIIMVKNLHKGWGDF